MGLDGTIKRSDGKPLGDIATVQQSLSFAFPGIVVGRSPSGAEKIRKAAERGIVFPDVIRKSLEATPARHGGEYSGPEFSAQFILGSEEVVQQIDVVLYGQKNGIASEPMFTLAR